MFSRSSAGVSAPPLWRKAMVTGLRNEGILAFVSVLGAWLGTMLLRMILPDRPLSFVLFFGAVALSAGLGGLRAGALATLLSALTCDYFFLMPLHSFTVAASDVPLLILFIVSALLINGLSGRLRAQTRQADERYLQLVQGLDGIVWEMNPRTMQFTFVNRRAEILLGYPVRQWIEDPGFRMRITHPSETARMQRFWDEAIAEGGEHTTDYRVVAANSGEIWLRETVLVGRDSGGRPNRITGLGIDITARKAEADELTGLKDEFAALNAISAALSGALELPAFLAILRNQLCRYLSAEAGCLFLAEGDGDDLRLVDHWGDSLDAASAMSLQPAWADTISQPGATEGVSLPQAEADRLSAIPLPVELAREWRGAISIPLVAKEHLQGALMVFGSDPLPVGGTRADFYTTLGRQIGTLLHNVMLHEEVQSGRERLHQLSRQLVNVQEAERRAIARELHDEIGQALTGIKLTLEMSARLPPEARERQLGEALGLVQELIRQVEGLSLDLRPAMLDDLGLLPALYWHCRRYTAATGINVQIEHTAIGGRFPAEIEITAYRIIQEALTNVARHAGTDSAAVRLWATREILGLQVADSGRGFDLEAVTEEPSSGGLTGMQERARLLDGHLTVDTAPGMGTTITVDLPLCVSASGEE